MNKQQLQEKVFFLTESLKKRIKKEAEELKEPIRVSKCCYSETDVSGGGYDGEDIVPMIRFCKNCDKECSIIEIKPDGWVDTKKELPF